MTKRPTRLSLRRTPLQVLMESVECQSLANGDICVSPKWRGVREWTEEDGGGPGLMTRMEGATRMQRVLNVHLAGRPKRAFVKSRKPLAKSRRKS